MGGGFGRLGACAAVAICRSVRGTIDLEAELDQRLIVSVLMDYPLSESWASYAEGGMTHPTTALLATVIYLVVLIFPASASDRVALVIGNSAYTYAPPLTNPAHDGEDIAAALAKLGFDVISGNDATKAQMDVTVARFAHALRGAEIGVFFYAGHGLQFNGENYLVPIDAKLESQAALETEAIQLAKIQRIMEASTKTNVLFLDACRNNPLARNLARSLGTRSIGLGRGLAPTEAGLGTLISYATQPGAVANDGQGRNSPFTGSLKRHILIPGEDLTSILIRVRNDVLAVTNSKQVPWDHHALRARLYLSTPPDSVPNKRDVAANQQFLPGTTYRDTKISGQVCTSCPELVVIPAGSFVMGSREDDLERATNEGPRHEVKVESNLAVGKYEITFAEWDACVAEGGCAGHTPIDNGWGRIRRPVANVSWDDAQSYIKWLRSTTGQNYRLLSEAEWEYAARSGTDTSFSFGDDIAQLCKYANGADKETTSIVQRNERCSDGFADKTAPVGSFLPNAFGLHDMHGNVWEWVADCRTDQYAGADGAQPASHTECSERVVRGGSWAVIPRGLRSAFRAFLKPDYHDDDVGFRVVRDLAN